MGSMNTLILSMKVFLISAGVLSLAMGIKFSIPVAANGIPAVWSIILLWLKPPYLYIVINGIIITIAASSRFHHGKSEPSIRSDHDQHSISVKPAPPSDFESLSAHPSDFESLSAPPSDFASLSAQPSDFESSAAQPLISADTEDLTAEVVVYESEDRVVELKPVLVNGSKVDFVTGEEEIVAEIEAGDMFIDSSPKEIISSELHQMEMESLFPVREKPLISSRFGHRKPIRTSPEVPSGIRRLRVARPKKQDTLESTWKAITEGRHVPLTRHLKKSETFEQHGHHQVTPAVDHVTKSETFNTSHEPRLKIRKEPSLGQEELNRRVEAFIKKFNEDMRMQRQESLNQYMEMINRGV